MAENVDRVSRLLEDIERSASKPTTPGGWYDQDSDSLFYFNEDVPYLRHRVDDLLTVYRAKDDERIVGVLIKDLGKLPKHDRLEVFVRNGRLPLLILLILTVSQQAGRSEHLRAPSSVYGDLLDAFPMQQHTVPAEELQAVLT